MADDNDRGGISGATFCVGMAQVFIMMYLVLMVAARSEDNWVRISVQCLLLALVVLYTGATVWYRFRKGSPKEPLA
jgi:predicted membrane channel-forming protein YqfA (hemolysin III family)